MRLTFRRLLRLSTASPTHAAVALACLSAVLLASPPAVEAQITSVYAIKHDFNGTDGNTPVGSLIQGTDGIYGVTYEGGSAGRGTAFSYSSFESYFNSFHSFAPVDNQFINSDGANPLAGLMQASDGNYYGTTDQGGNNHPGTIYQVSFSSHAVSVIYQFSALDKDYSNGDGAFPESNLVEGVGGYLFGTASRGGSFGLGAFFEVTTAGQLTALWSFTEADGQGHNPDGITPIGDLLLASDGYFYGVTLAGGEHGAGVVFRFTPTGGQTTLYSFGTAANDGATPEAGLIQASDGNFYGSTLQGGRNGTGTIFRITAGGVLTTLHTFAAYTNSNAQINTDGSAPKGRLLQASDGNFYGTTAFGGTYGEGTIFQMTPAGVLTTLHVFGSTPTDGAMPFSGLIEDEFGSFYGLTSAGGALGDGTLYELRLTPVITSATAASGTAGTPFTYQITASDNPVQYGADGLPDGLAVDAKTGLISGSPTQAGTFTVTLYASNVFATGEGSLTLTISAAATAPAVLAPSITSAPSANGQVGIAFSYQIAATNSPDTFAATGLPDGLSLDGTSGLISGTPAVAGTFAVSLFATNAGGTGTAALALTIIAAGVPAITSAAEATGQVGVPFNYQIAASNSPASYSASGLPAGLSVDLTSGLISGTPTAAGTFPVTLSATNAFGAASAPLTLTIAAADPVATLPVATLNVTTSTVTLGSGEIGEFIVSLSAAQTAQVQVNYTIKGTAINGTDYVLLTGHKKFKPGKTSKPIKIAPMGDLEGAAKKTVKITLSNGSGYTIGTVGSEKVEIFAAAP